ncbi:thiamine diphosphokinase [Sedimentitalea todarodis]|uniref:Thiamine diphosphokinase n=1 Tax=Sedimentitalea todarodis TaxID=1631240 RepID=A0ABU3VFH6_9RHOB|nr:thiamine diphosphokinase [Sedimentitalea todarodis]MDU9004843.1 thiamine diphosphokinase [Sedimentitalea todarodis]
MNDANIQSKRGITLVGGGTVGPDDIEMALRLAPMLVAVDGGASSALAGGHDIHAVVGDFDSLTAQDRARIPADRLFQIAEQDSTDFEKALRCIAAPVILAVGFLGARLDHQFAAFNALVRYPGKPCILIGETEIVLHVPPVLVLDLTAGDVVSLFPMAAVSGRSQGLKWPIDGLALSPDGRIGTSNRATGRVRLRVDGAGLLAIVPRRALAAAVTALASSRRHASVGQLPAQWPARA